MRGGGVPLSQLADRLSRTVQRTVVDRTGLSGNFDFTLSWTPDRLPPGERPLGAPEAPPIDPDGPSLFTALREQLGLKLESERGSGPVFLIARVEPPTED